MNLPSQDSATGRGLKSGAYGALAGVITFLGGLWVVIQGVPACADTILSYVNDHWMELAIGIGAAVGFQTGGLSFLINFFRKDIKNY